jgi:glycosyltransferase involved in cell wall biosynthesis
MLHKNLLFFSLEEWNQVWRRNQFICSLLHRRHPDMRLLWVSPPVQVSPGRSLPELEVQSLSEFPNISLATPLKLLPNTIGRALNDHALHACVVSAVKQLGWKDFTIWVNDQSVRNIIPLFPGKKIIYDITDDWTETSMPARIRRRADRDDAWLLAHADVVIVCSQRLYQLKSGKCHSLSLIPNGVEAERYAPACLAQLQKPADMLNFSSPVAGYTGTLHEDRLDVELIRAVARIQPDTQFVLVGPDCLKPSVSKSLRELPNLHIMGARAYEELPAYLASFDVCIVPHRVSPFTESLDPLKLYEYCSTGKPIVSTPCAGFRDMNCLISLARGADEFSARIADLIAKPDFEAGALRVAWAAKQSWIDRVERIERLLAWR